LKQEDALAPLLFNIALKMTLQQVQCRLIGTVFNKSHIVLAYADNIVVLSQSKVHMIETFNKIETEAKKFVLKVNNKKTKIMQLTRNRIIHPETLMINNHVFEIVDEFKYLGSTVNNSNNISNEIQYRIMLGNKCYFSLIILLKSKNISTVAKCKLYKTVIQPIVTYGAETWATNNSDERTQPSKGKYLDQW
jgi:hypothetical protein